MEVKKMVQVFFSVGLILTFTLNHQQILARELNRGEGIVKAAHTTLLAHDEIEVHEFIHKIFTKKKERLFSKGREI